MENIVVSCPQNTTEVKESSIRLGCGQDQYGNDQYICVPNIDKTGLIELCYNGIMGIIERGNCLRTTGGQLYRTSCLGFSSGCPDIEYRSNKIYLYPACQNINTQDRCYFSEPSCPNTTESISTRGITKYKLGLTTFQSIYNTTTNNVLEVTIPQESHDYTGAIIGSVVAVVFIIILVLSGVLWKLNQRNKKQRPIPLGGESEDGEINKQHREEDIPTAPDYKRPLLSYDTEPTDETFRKPDGREYEHTEGGQDIDKEKKIYMGTAWESEDGEIKIQHKEENKATEPDGCSTKYLGDYNLWKTKLSDQFSTLTDDEVSVLFCFLCSDSGPPDFTDKESLNLLNEIRYDQYDEENPVTHEEAQQILDKLKSRDYLWEDQDKITEDTKDETMYKISAKKHYVLFYYSSYDTASVYLRSQRYSRKLGEKCVISGGIFDDSLLIRRLQINILTHVTMEDTDIYDEICQMLNIPEHNIKSDKDKRQEFLTELRRGGEGVHYRGRSHDSVDQVTWLWRYRLSMRPDIVRSCIGLHPHNDIYIIDNKAYRKPSEFHNYPQELRCLLYSLLLTEKYQLNLNKEPHKITRNKIKDRYFTDITEDGLVNLPDGITETRDGVISFISDNIRHDVMYAFVTECLVKDSDMEFFLSTASRDLISEYCRSWGYGRSEGERCLYVPDQPEKMYDLFIDKLQLDIMTHCTMSDVAIHYYICRGLGVPSEVLEWDQEARERYVKYAQRGTQTVHHARGMIVGCAGAGKTTLLKRLFGCTEEEIKEVISTEGLEVHEEIFDICDKTKSLKARKKINKDDKNEDGYVINVDFKALTFFDFGGQCAYYACHQIYLTRRAFYVVVVDASKRLDQKVDRAVCDQDGSVFSGWTYGDYFVFWIKSIHTFCGSDNEKDPKPTVLIVATHWEKGNKLYQDKESLLQSLQQQLPKESNLSQYIVEKNCYYTYFPVQTLHDLQQHIFDIASHQRWKESIPKEWAFFEIEINVKKKSARILDVAELTIEHTDNTEQKQENPRKDLKRKKDMLRYYHDAGKVLYFNEEELQQYVIIDVQWFIDAFKHIIIDKLHFKGIAAAQMDWNEYYKTGHLKDHLLTEIWKHEDERLKEQLIREEIKDANCNFENNPRYLLHHKEALLRFMQGLGLIAVGKESHYIPCMNRKEIETVIPDLIQRSESKTSVLIYRFSFLPFFLFCRLVVSCMQLKNWKVLITEETSCLYRNAALFSVYKCNIIISVTETSIQLQVFHPIPGCPLEKEKTYNIQSTIEGILNEISGTFHRRMLFERGFKCRDDKTQMIALDIDGYFLQERYICEEDGEIICPLHPIIDQHFINTDEMTKFWNMTKDC